MDLRTYLAEQGMTQMELAKQLGVTRAAVGQWVTGVAIPRGRTAARIVRLTHGQVTLDDLFPPDEGGAVATPPAKEAA